MRTKSWEESIREDRSEGATRTMVVEPGDCTRYCMLFTDVPGTQAEVVGLSESYLVTCTNLVYDRPAASMFVRTGQLVTWRDVRDHMGVDAEGSCQLIAELCSHVVGSKCQTWEEFEDAYARHVAWQERQQREELDEEPDES